MTKTQSKVSMTSGQILSSDHVKNKMPDQPKKEKHLVHWFRKGLCRFTGKVHVFQTKKFVEIRLSKSHSMTHGFFF
jgi:hypothetical protein